MIIIRSSVLKQKLYAGATLDLTDIGTFNKYRNMAEEAAKQKAVKERAVSMLRSKGNKTANKAANRERMIREGSWRGERMNIDPSLIEATAGKKLTWANPDFSNPSLNSAQEEILRRKRRIQKSTWDNKNYIGSGEQLTKEERWARLSDGAKRKFKQQQELRRANEQAANLIPKSKTERIKSLSPRSYAKFKDANSMRLHGKSREEVKFERFKSRRGDNLADKNSGYMQEFARSKEYRISNLSEKNRELLNKKRLERERLKAATAQQQIPTATTPTTSLPAKVTSPALVQPKGNNLPAVVNKTANPTVVPTTPKVHTVPSTNPVNNVKGSRNIGNNLSRKTKIPASLRRNKRALLIGGGLAALGGAGIYGYKKYKDNKKE